MNARDLRYFAATARLGSFSAVGKDEGVDPSTISRAIASLEEELGVRLFDRTTRRMHLTEAGELYLTRVVPLFEEIERLGETARDAEYEPGGTLRIHASPEIGQRLLVPGLAGFRTTHPKIRIDCLLSEAEIDILAERVDLALRADPADPPEFVSTPLAKTPLMAVASAAYLNRTAPLFQPSDLRLHACLMQREGGFRSSWHFATAEGHRIEQPIQGDVAIASTAGVLSACLAGLGPALLPGWLVADDLAAGRLVRLFPEWTISSPRQSGEVWMIYPSRPFLPFKTRAAIDMLKRML